MLTGRVMLIPEAHGEKRIPLANHEIIATDVKSGKRYTANTNHGGMYVFELPAGTYDVAAAPQYGLREVESGARSTLPRGVEVLNGWCWQRDFGVKQDH